MPVQARAQETVDVILEASARILESDGLRGFNTNAIATKAGVSVGSLYQYFPNKDAIVLALIGRFEEKLFDAVLNATQRGKGKKLKPCLRRLVRALVEVHYSRPRLNRVLESEEERVFDSLDQLQFSMAGLAEWIRHWIVVAALPQRLRCLAASHFLAIVRTSFDEESRGQAIGTWSGFTAITTAAGPVLGGWLPGVRSAAAHLECSSR